jgi:hypothetical protein
LIELPSKEKPTYIKAMAHKVVVATSFAGKCLDSRAVKKMIIEADRIPTMVIITFIISIGYEFGCNTLSYISVTAKVLRIENSVQTNPCHIRT